MAGVFASCSVYLYDPTYPLRQREFAADTWREGDVRTRGEMVQDLLDSGRLIGMERGAIVELLGDPVTAEPKEILSRFDFLTPERAREIMGDPETASARYLYYSVETGYRRWDYGISIVLDETGVARNQFLHD